MGVHCGWGRPPWGVENVKAGVVTSMPATVPEAPSPSPLPATDEDTESDEDDEEDGEAAPAVRVVLLMVVVVVVVVTTAPSPPGAAAGAGAGVAVEAAPAPLVGAPRDRVWKKELKLSITMWWCAVACGVSASVHGSSSSPNKSFFRQRVSLGRGKESGKRPVCVWRRAGKEAQSGHDEDEDILLLAVVLRERGCWKRHHNTQRRSIESII